MSPTANLASWGNKIGVTTSFSKYSGSQPDSEFLTIEPKLNKRVTAWVKPRYRKALYDWEDGSVYLRVSLTSRAYTAPGYALSDMYATIDQYRVSSPHEYLGSFTMVFSRSECAVTTPTRDHQPLAVEFEPPTPPTYPADPAAIPVAEVAAPMPNANGIVTTVASRMEMRGTLESSPTTSNLPSTTTVTSPTEHTTASETTTSAPPNPDDDASTSSTRTTRTNTATSTAGTSKKPSTTKVPTTSVASTSPSAPTSVSAPPAGPTTTVTSPAAPETAIPAKPGTLSATAQTEDARTVNVDGVELVVVAVEGTSVPADAKQGAAALEIWLGGGTPGANWETFASDDPDEDGWRWAAISQTTGTVVYIR